jgi:hypothetical protein
MESPNRAKFLMLKLLPAVPASCNERMLPNLQKDRTLKLLPNAP